MRQNWLVQNQKKLAKCDEKLRGFLPHCAKKGEIFFTVADMDDGIRVKKMHFFLRRNHIVPKSFGKNMYNHQNGDVIVDAA